MIVRDQYVESCIRVMRSYLIWTAYALLTPILAYAPQMTEHAYNGKGVVRTCSSAGTM